MGSILGQDDFIERCKIIRKDSFDYSKSIFTGVDSEIIVTCKLHGDIKTTPYRHWNVKHPCKKCHSSERLVNKKIDYINDLKLNNKYFRESIYEFIDFDEKDIRQGYFKSEYSVHRCYLHSMLLGDQKLTANSTSDVDYYYRNMLLDKNEGFRSGIFSIKGVISRQKAPLTIIVRDTREEIETSLHSLLRGCFSKVDQPKKDPIKKVKFNRIEKYSKLYFEKIKQSRVDFCNIDYSFFEYKYAKSSCKFRCKIHDLMYEQRLDHHINNVQGCPSCKELKATGVYTKTNIEERYSSKEGFLYVVRLFSNEESFFKVGITRRSIKDRIKEFKGNGYNTDVIHLEKGLLIDVFEKEEMFLRLFEDYKHQPLNKFGGHTECFSENIWDIFYSWNCASEEYKIEMDKILCEESGIDYEQQLYCK